MSTGQTAWHSDLFKEWFREYLIKYVIKKLSYLLQILLFKKGLDSS